MKATLHDVASAAECSVSTVSRVLNGREGYFDAATRDRVLAVAHRLGYRANAGARATRNGHQGAVTLLMSSRGESRSALPQALLQGIHDALEAHHLHLNIAMLPDERLTDPSYVPRILSEWTSDGLLVDYNKMLPEGLEAVIEGARVPAIWINHKRSTDACHPDDLDAGAEAVRKLTSLGHRRIVYCTFSNVEGQTHYSEEDRRQGYLDAMQAAGLESRVLERHGEPPVPASRTDTWCRMLSRPDRPTAVIAYGGTAVLHVVRAVDRLGLAIPADLSVMTFGGEVAFAGQDIDTLLVPEKNVGHRAVEMLLAKIATPEAALPASAIPFNHKGIGSVAPPSPTLRYGTLKADDTCTVENSTQKGRSA